jgi:hypothetical protein
MGGARGVCAVTVLLFREFFLSGTSMLGVDSLALSYFARDFYTEFVQSQHRMPLWNPLLFGGMPFVEAMHGDIFYPPSLACSSWTRGPCGGGRWRCTYSWPASSPTCGCGAG